MFGRNGAVAHEPAQHERDDHLTEQSSHGAHAAHDARRHGKMPRGHLPQRGHRVGSAESPHARAQQNLGHHHPCKRRGLAQHGHPQNPQTAQQHAQRGYALGPETIRQSAPARRSQHLREALHHHAQPGVKRREAPHQKKEIITFVEEKMGYLRLEIQNKIEKSVLNENSSLK